MAVDNSRTAVDDNHTAVDDTHMADHFRGPVPCPQHVQLFCTAVWMPSFLHPGPEEWLPASSYRDLIVMGASSGFSLVTV